MNIYIYIYISKPKKSSNGGPSRYINISWITYINLTCITLSIYLSTCI